MAGVVTRRSWCACPSTSWAPPMNLRHTALRNRSSRGLMRAALHRASSQSQPCTTGATPAIPVCAAVGRLAQLPTFTVRQVRPAGRTRIGIGMPSRAVPATPPDMRVRIRRFGELGSDVDFELRQAVGFEPAFGEDPIEQRGAARCHGPSEEPASLRTHGRATALLARLTFSFSRPSTMAVLFSKARNAARWLRTWTSQSSAYRTNRSPRSSRSRSSSSSTRLAGNGESVPPCGVPTRVGRTTPGSIAPACRKRRTIQRSRLSAMRAPSRLISRSWLTWSKNASRSRSTTQSYPSRMYF